MLRDGSGSDREDPRQAGGAAGVPPWLVGASCDLGMSALVRKQAIPRLVAAHSAPDGPSAPGADAPGTPAIAPFSPALDPELVADIAIGQDASLLLDRLEAALSAGSTVEDLMIDVLAPAARILGVRWESDMADFIEVTMGLWRLQESVHALSSRRRRLLADNAAGCRVLCAVMPGDDHGFGSIMLEEMFVHAGWIADGCRHGLTEDLVGHVAGSWFDVIALTASIDQPIARLREIIAALRNASINPAVGLLVGGRLFSANPGLADAIGADATADDGRAGIAAAAALVGRLAPGRALHPHRNRHGRAGDMAMRGSARFG